MFQSKAILILYGTRYGATKTIAKQIGAHLQKNGLETQVLDMKKTSPKQIGSLDQYNAIIAGASVAIFHVLPKAKSFLKKMKSSINSSGIPFILYLTCGISVNNREGAKEKFNSRFIEKIVAAVS
jgi:menaquinone-dependent protoporphyrinogen IX oxidase